MIGDVAANSPSNTADETAENQQQEKPWHSYIYEDLPRTVQESVDSAVRSARSLQQNSSTHIRTLQVLYLYLSHVRVRFISCAAFLIVRASVYTMNVYLRAFYDGFY